MNSVCIQEPVIKKKIQKYNVWRPTLFLSSFKQNYEFSAKLKSKKKKKKKKWLLRSWSLQNTSTRTFRSLLHSFNNHEKYTVIPVQIPRFIVSS